jgi:cytosine/adenosine deaminase-related metal-dependent hydrolase
VFERRSDGLAASWLRDRSDMPLKRCWHAELALLPSGVASHVLIEADGERIGALTPNADPTADASRLPGLTIPGLANAHSHAFHRALRGRTQRDGGDFWTWRRRMYELAARLDPDSYRALATAVYAEMTLGSPQSASSSTSTTTREAAPTPTRTRWASHCRPRPPRRASASP